MFEAMADKVDEGAKEIVREINTAFVAPLDRENIYRLTSALDDVLDEIEAAAECITLFNIPEPLPQMVTWPTPSFRPLS